MSKPFLPSAAAPGVLTANRLSDGRCIWQAPAGWTTDPRAATLYDDEAAAEAALTAAQAQPDIVVGPYLVEAIPTPEGPAPAHFREAFRQAGPSTEPAASHREAAIV